MSTPYEWTPTATSYSENWPSTGDLLFSTDPQRAVARAFAEEIVGSAEHVIRLASPMVESLQVVELLRAARNRHVRVHILTELAPERVKGEPRFLSDGTRPKPRGEGDQSHDRCRRLLGEALVHCRSCPHHMHAKLWIADDRIAFLGSVNLTDRSLGYAPGSMEAMIRILDLQTVAALADSFDALWRHTPLRQHLHGEHLRIERRTMRPPALETYSTPVHDGLELHWNIPGESSAVVDALAGQIDSAHRSVVLCARSLVDLHEVPEIVEAVRGALSRGVSVTSVVAQDADFMSQYPDPPTLKLLKRGMIIKGWPGLHVKGVAADNQSVSILSANFNPSLSRSNPGANIECGLFCTTGEHPFAGFAEYLLRLSQRAPFMLTPPQV